jgi:uncharacterized protein
MVLDAYIPDSCSLKAKRRVIRPIIDRIRARMNVSIAEVDFQDAWQRTRLAVAAVACDEQGVRRLLGDALRQVESCPELVCTLVETEVI